MFVCLFVCLLRCLLVLSLMNLGEVCWRHHLLNVSTSLQAEVGVIKDMVMLINSSAYLLVMK